MTHPREPLGPDLAALVDQARSLDSVPPEVGRRILASLAARVAAANGDGGPGGEGGLDSGSRAASGRVVPMSRSAAMVLGSFLVGVVVGAVVRRPMPPVDRIVYVDRAPSSTSARADEVPRPSADPAATAEPPATRAAPSRAATPSDDSSERLAAESALLDLARTAIARGEGERALDAIGRHTTQFPRGLLAEEREALAVKALHLVGRDGEARARAERFESTYPRSLLRQAVRSAVAAPQ